jgi:hypothetical protein
MKKDRNRIPGDAIKSVMTPNHKNMALDFSSKTMTGVLYVNVKSGVVKICNDPNVEIGKLPVSFTVVEYEDSTKFVEFLDTIDTDDISNVILDNVTDFKTMSLEEFIKRCKVSMVTSPTEIDHTEHSATATADVVAIDSTMVDEVVTRELECGVDNSYNSVDIADDQPQIVPESEESTKTSFYKP